MTSSVTPKVLLDPKMKSRKHSPKDATIPVQCPLCPQTFMKMHFLRDSRGSAEEIARGSRKDTKEKTRKEDREGSHRAKQEWQGRGHRPGSQQSIEWQQKYFLPSGRFLTGRNGRLHLTTAAPNFFQPLFHSIIQIRKGLCYTEMCKQGMEATRRKPRISSKSIVIPIVIPNHRLFL